MEPLHVLVTGSPQPVAKNRTAHAPRHELSNFLILLLLLSGEFVTKNKAQKA